MTSALLRKAAAAIRAKAEARTAVPAGATNCMRADHPARSHGHHGYGGVHWCSDFNSPLLNEENMGSRHVYAKPVGSPDLYALAVADLLAHEADRADHQPYTDSAIDAAEVLAGRVLGVEVEVEP